MSSEVQQLHPLHIPALVDIGSGYCPVRKAAYLFPMSGAQCKLSALGPGVIGANMQSKLLVALQLQVTHHFIERCASGRNRGLKPPATFGATKAAKMHWINPHQRSAHGCICRCAPTSSDRKLGAGSSTNKASSFRRSYCLIARETPSGSDGTSVKQRSLHAPIWPVCRTSYICG